jgi:hypothetical protein
LQVELYKKVSMHGCQLEPAYMSNIDRWKEHISNGEFEQPEFRFFHLTRIAGIGYQSEPSKFKSSLP